MKKILFTPGIASVEALGSITRLIAIADEIKNKDSSCEILFRSAGKEGDYAKECGYKVVEGYKPKFNVNSFIQKDSTPKSSHNYCISRSCDVIKLKCLDSKEYIQNTFKEEMELVQSFKPDIIVGEFEMIMPIVAKKMDIPYFCSGGTPNRKDFSKYGFTNKTSNNLSENYNELLDSLNLKKIENACELIQDYNSSKVLVPSIPELEDFEDDSKYLFLGSIIPKNFIKSNFNFKKRRPLIYVYLSVGEIKPNLYQKVLLDTFTDSEFDVIVTGGGNPQFNKDLSSNNDNVHFMNMVPADKVMEIADIAIHHGGQNTTVQCIENKVPSIIFPGNHFERYYNAQKASEVGCAINAKIEDFNKEFLINTCRKLLKDKNMKQNLKIYSDKIKDCNGISKAAEFILNY